MNNNSQNHPLPLEIIFEDNHLFVVNKPAGILTQPSGTDQYNLEAMCKQWIKEVLKKPGNVFLEAIHRLDKPVGGIVVFARTSKALSRLNVSMREKQTLKTYTALIEGNSSILNREGTLEHFLRHDDHFAEVVKEGTPDAKRARLHYRVIERKENESLVEIILETGRYHQIRAQFSAIGLPIVGDTKYGSRRSISGGIIALHHSKLQIPHPITAELLTFESPANFVE